MPSYTETFPCDVCCGTTTSTTPSPNQCPNGYDFCAEGSSWYWDSNANTWLQSTPDPYPCPQGCTGFAPSVNGTSPGQISVGVCCQLAGTTTTSTTTTLEPTSTTPAPSGCCKSYECVNSINGIIGEGQNWVLTASYSSNTNCSSGSSSGCDAFNGQLIDPNEAGRSYTVWTIDPC